jgi:peptidoglycan/LPS O-acetylase OafA/YrhL
MDTTTPPEPRPQPEPARASEPRRVFFPCFDGYRALAAGAVLLLHVGVASGFVFRNEDIGQYVFRLDVGVAVFFLISGFLLYRPFVAAHLTDGGAGPRLRNYFRGRFLRIFPAYWVALTAVVLFQHGPTHRIHDFGDFIAYYGLLQQYTVRHHFGGIQQAWTLCVEVSFYLFLPMWAWAMRSLAKRAANRLAVELGGLVVLYATGLLWRGLFAHLDPSHSNLGLHVLPAFFDEFALGMGLAVLSVWFVRNGRTWRPFELAGRYPWVCWLLAAVCFWAASTQLDIPQNYGILSAKQWLAWTISYGLTAFFLLLPGIFGPQDRGVVRGFLRNPVIRYLGIVSYGVYLWHEFFIDKYFDWTGNTRLALTGSTLVGFVVFVAGLSVLAATISYYVVERPALRLRAGGLSHYREEGARAATESRSRA